MPLDFDTRLLRMFVTLAREGNHTRAGKVLHLTQSAVSHGMKRLEEQLGCSLVYHKGKTTCLTPEGRQFLAQATKILENLDQATEAVSSKGRERTTLSISFSASMAHAILAPVLSEFRSMYPHVTLGIRLEDSYQALKQVEDGHADLAIVIDDNLSQGLKAHSLFRDELSFLFSPEHRWAGKKQISSADLKEQHFLLYRRDSVTFQRVQDLFFRSGMNLNSYVEIPSFDIIKQVARLGLGVALMASWVAAQEIAQGLLIARKTPRFQVVRHWKIVQQGGREIRPSEEAFIRCCRRAVRTISPSNDGF